MLIAIGFRKETHEYELSCRANSESDVRIGRNAARLVILAVWGLGCDNCVNRMRNSFLQLAGVVSADIGLAHGLAVVGYAPSSTDVQALLGDVAAAGDDARQHNRAEIMTWPKRIPMSISLKQQLARRHQVQRARQSNQQFRFARLVLSF